MERYLDVLPDGRKKGDFSAGSVTILEWSVVGLDLRGQDLFRGQARSSSVLTTDIAGYVCPTEALCLPMSIERSSSVVFKYTGLSKFMLFMFLCCQFRHIK